MVLLDEEAEAGGGLDVDGVLEVQDLTGRIVRYSDSGLLLVHGLDELLRGREVRQDGGEQRGVVGEEVGGAGLVAESRFQPFEWQKIGRSELAHLESRMGRVW